MINLKAELEVRTLHQKITIMMEDQFKTILESQAMVGKGHEQNYRKVIWNKRKSDQSQYPNISMKKSPEQTNCSDTAEKLMPIVNFNSCSGKEDCVTVCPYNVFEMKTITQEDKAKLSLKGQIKTFFFKQKAYVINPEQCHACGLCIQACPEKAIKLTRFITAE